MSQLFKNYWFREFTEYLTRRLLIALAIAPLVTVACDSDHTSTSPVAPTAAPPQQSDVLTDTSDAMLRARLQAHPDLFPYFGRGSIQPNFFTPPVRQPAPPPPQAPYNAVYQDCMVVMAITNATRGKPMVADAYCDGLARTVSGTPRPNWNGPRQAYYTCLNVFTVRGAADVIEPITLVCHGPDAALPPD